MDSSGSGLYHFYRVPLSSHDLSPSGHRPSAGQPSPSSDSLPPSGYSQSPSGLCLWLNGRSAHRVRKGRLVLSAREVSVASGHRPSAGQPSPSGDSLSVWQPLPSGHRPSAGQPSPSSDSLSPSGLCLWLNGRSAHHLRKVLSEEEASFFPDSSFLRLTGETGEINIFFTNQIHDETGRI